LKFFFFDYQVFLGISEKLKLKREKEIISLQSSAGIISFSSSSPHCHLLWEQGATHPST